MFYTATVASHYFDCYFYFFFTQGKAAILCRVFVNVYAVTEIESKRAVITFAESIIPSSGVFVVKLAKRGAGLGITISCKLYACCANVVLQMSRYISQF